MTKTFRVPAAIGLSLLLMPFLPGLSGTAHAGPNRNAKIQIHMSFPVKNPGGATPLSTGLCDYRGIVPCSSIQTNASLYPAWTPPFAFLLVTDGDAAAGVAGLECSVDYLAAWGAGADVFSWSTCWFVGSVNTIPGPFGDWPMPGSTLMLSGSPDLECGRTEPGGAGTGAVVPAGYFYVAAYTADTLRVIASPVSGLATVSSCAGDVDTVAGGDIPHSMSHLGSAVFSAGGTSTGYNPCGLNTPLETTTWSRVKGLFRP